MHLRSSIGYALQHKRTAERSLSRVHVQELHSRGAVPMRSRQEVPCEGSVSSRLRLRMPSLQCEMRCSNEATSPNATCSYATRTIPSCSRHQACATCSGVSLQPSTPASSSHGSDGTNPALHGRDHLCAPENDRKGRATGAGVRFFRSTREAVMRGVFIPRSCRVRISRHERGER